MTPAQKDWRFAVVEYARRTTREDLSEIDAERPGEETAGTLELVAKALATAWVQVGYPQEVVERAFVAAASPSNDLDAIWTELSEWSRVEIEISKRVEVKALKALTGLGGTLALLGLVLFFLNSAVILFDGPAGMVAWLAPTLLFVGVMLALLSVSAIGRLRRKQQRWRAGT